MKTPRSPIAVAVAVLVAGGVIVATPPAGAAGETVTVYQTTTDLADHLTQKSDVAFTSGGGSSANTLTINEGRRYQTIVGFGASITDSSAYLLHDKVAATPRAQIMSDLFTTTGANGIGLTYLRQPGGATDFIKDDRGYYTFDDMPTGQTDPTLAHFTIAHDQAYIIPILQEALSANPGIKIQLNLWSAPAWMKTNGTLHNGGGLLPQYREAYAALVVKSIQAYEAEGIPIWATSVVNEPTVPVLQYPEMYLSAADSAKIIRDHLQPKLLAAGLSTRILGGDDWQFDTTYPAQVIDSDAHVSSEVPATASHGYAGDFHALSRLHDFYPNKDVYQTELSPGCAYAPIDLFMRTVRNWAQTTVTWNVALDPDGGPYHHPEESPTCTPLVQVTPSTGATSYTSDFYQEGQIAKFVRPGAIRVDTNETTDIPNLAFINTDGSRVMVAWNKSASSRVISVNWGDQHFDYTMPAGAVTTFTWSGAPAGDAAGWGASTFGTSNATGYAGGLVRGTWSIADGSTLSQTAFGGAEWQSIYYGYADHGDFTVKADVTSVAAGTTAGAPKYGVYACYHDVNNYVQAFIDPGNAKYVTHAVAGGTDLGFVDNDLPGGFDAATAHTIRVSRTGDSFSFALDGSAIGSTRTARVGSLCQLGLVTEDYKADFANVSIVDPLRWGASQQGTDTNIYDGGLRRGDWATAGPDSATLTSQGSGWAELFRGYLAGNQTFSVAVTGVDAGSTSSFPKYGIYAAYRNKDNYVQGWIDPTSGNFVTHGRVGASEISWHNTALPAGFDPHVPHVISVARSGSTFVFSLDGSTVDTVTAAIGNGQIGLVSEDHTARYRDISVSSDAATPGIDTSIHYQLANAKSLRQLGVLGGATTNSSTADIYDPVAALDQNWQFVSAGSGYYKIVNQKSGKLLSCLSGGTANDTPAIIYGDVGATDQLWLVQRDSDGYYTLTNQRSGRVLSVSSGGTENEDGVVIRDGASARDQLWSLVPAR